MLKVDTVYKLHVIENYLKAQNDYYKLNSKIAE